MADDSCSCRLRRCLASGIRGVCYLAQYALNQGDTDAIPCGEDTGAGGEHVMAQTMSKKALLSNLTAEHTSMLLSKAAYVLLQAALEWNSFSPDSVFAFRH